MNDRVAFIAKVSQWVHRYFLWLLLGSYAAAAGWPAFGGWIRGVSIAEVALFGDKTGITLPMVMLALLLLHAGLGVHPSRLRGLLRGPQVLMAGLAANFLVPLAFILGVSQLMRLWHNPEEVQQILVGLALIAFMPIAGSSTAWSQNSDGNLELSLGLVLISTALSPLTTPVALHSVSWLTTGDYAEDLQELANSGTGAFLTVCVVLPSFLGILVR
jgi:BASS family bile acid:Na+ symporter